MALNFSDAEMVEVFHTNGLTIGKFKYEINII